MWQKNEGTYFPEWLRELANAIVHPVEISPELAKEIAGAEVKQLMGGTYLSWQLESGNGTDRAWMGAGISFKTDSGLLYTVNGFGWGGWYRDYAIFHNRQVARRISSGSPEVTARISVLEDLGAMPEGWFDASAAGGDSPTVKTVATDELTLRRNLQSGEALTWPAVQDGPLEGVLTTEIAVDREGKVREVGTIVSANPGMNEAARRQIEAMHFRPFVDQGEPVQVYSRITLGFKTARPAGTASFESARTWFERGRKAGFLAAAATQPYRLTAEFQAGSKTGQVLTGKYEDTWMNATQWRREATLGASRLVRTRDGEKTFVLSEGPDAGLLALLFQILEPIPALDTFVESDWRIKQDRVDGADAVRVLSGYESPEGKLDAEHARGFWFGSSGDLEKTFFSGVETRRTLQQDFDGVRVARQVDVRKDSKLAMRIKVTEVGAAGPEPKDFFDLKGHEWKRAFTAEVR